jgi:hypothetical protein
MRDLTIRAAQPHRPDVGINDGISKMRAQLHATLTKAMNPTAEEIDML